MKKHPSLKLTLRKAFEKHYDVCELEPSSLRMLDFSIRAWERFIPANPPIGTIDNETVAAFRQKMVDAGLRPRSIKNYWGHLRQIFRRLGPQTDGNPLALDILPRVPAMKPVKQLLAMPYRIPLEDISRLYVGCASAQWPRVGVPSGDWWRALLVTAFCTGMRKSDLFSLRFDQIDAVGLTMTFTARKTQKSIDFPLHPVVIDHIERIRRPVRDTVFAGAFSKYCGGFYCTFRKLQERAKITRRFGLHDLRRTAASEMERVAPGMSPVMLQHAPRGVTASSYLNQLEELRDAINRMRMPIGFKPGPAMSQRREQQHRDDQVRLHKSTIFAPSGPVPGEWSFRPGQFAYRDTWYRLDGTSQRFLCKLASSTDPVPAADLEPLLLNAVENPTRRVQLEISRLRARLQRAFGLTNGWDPVPCVSRGTGGAWTLWIPPEVAKGGAA